MTETLKIALLPGDGIGPEVMTVAAEILAELVSRFQLPVELQSFPWPSHDWHQQHGEMMPADGVDLLRGFDAILLGALGDPGPIDDPQRYVLSDSISLAPLLALRKELNLWACERPARWLPGAPQYLADSRANDVDMLVIRENSEGEYSNQGGRLRAGTPSEVATQVEVFTAGATERLIRHAFERARQRAAQRHSPRQFKGDKHAQVCLITKRNAQPFWGDLYTETFARIAREYPDVDTHHELVDAACMKFVQCPWRFDVVVASNLHGDILTDLAAVLCGGPGLAPSANLNPADERIPALFEPVHGSAPDIAGRNMADPRATLMSLAMLLDHLAPKHPAIGNAAQHLHDLIAEDMKHAFSGTRETGQRLSQRLAAG
ncbi:isocitrate/isopropylmalate family dehydrogenase [Alcanivorax sp. S6407]|uniref:isocitrate/isopropylmalate dehydrogenase family protein n=1 Tax=Alcanivorax sp. S6407 TaxID=2926424 RepID=UPI001FF35AC7|nr:isocitrate/isopropylmalate family dehydrogenase [Alcanivorax sp. S6407]MCK0154946.1 isocitrate/isopropylmalate family dehydrogenase [Alcanivorax sp. S6407]